MARDELQVIDRDYSPQQFFLHHLKPDLDELRPDGLRLLGSCSTSRPLAPGGQTDCSASVVMRPGLH